MQHWHKPVHWSNLTVCLNVSWQVRGDERKERGVWMYVVISVLWAYYLLSGGLYWGMKF